MHDLSRHPFFVRWRDPATGAESFILKERVAPVQQAFYFTNPAVSPDEEWLWFVAAFPPNRQRILAVVHLDPARPEIRLFPQAGFTSESPMVAPDSAGACFGMGPSVYRVDLDGTVRTICTVPDAFLGGRRCTRVATHLTLSADGQNLLLDGDCGNAWWVGLGNVATGKVTILQEFDRHHNHAQFSPTDAELFLIAQDQHRDPVSGKFIHHRLRSFVMDTAGTRYECINPSHLCSPYRGACHEWWSRDGLACYIDYERGAYEHEVDTGVCRHVWKRAICHAHCSADRGLWCADQDPYRWQEDPVQILFFDRRRQRETAIVSAMPPPPVPREHYHLDPHPQFSPRDSWITYTTMVRGMVDVALAPVAPLLAG